MRIEDLIGSNSWIMNAELMFDLYCEHCGASAEMSVQMDGHYDNGSLTFEDFDLPANWTFDGNVCSCGECVDKRKKDIRQKSSMV